jgi:predicted RNA polymerase sigma factor
VVELDLAAAISRAQGLAAALPPVQALTSQPQLAQCQLLPSEMADLPARRAATTRRTRCGGATDLSRTARERELRLARVHHTPPEGDPP